MSPDAADRRLLSMASDKRKFALEFGQPVDPDLRASFERGIDEEWFTLVDVSFVATAGRRLMRVFRLTNAGMVRLERLAGPRQ
jgi:hypothetical protein